MRRLPLGKLVCQNIEIRLARCASVEGQTGRRFWGGSDVQNNARQPSIGAVAGTPDNTLGVMKYSLRKLVWNDWPALASSIAVPITWAIHFGFPLLQRGATPLPLWFPAGASVALVAVLAWRIRRVNWFFSNGTPVVGVITDLLIVKDRGRLEFEFEVDGKRVFSWTPIHKTKSVLSFSPGDRVDLLFDETKPTRAIVKGLYAK